MKRITLLLAGILSLPLFSYSGGIVTNQNQSAAYIRMFARDASTDIDAVFYNPAGLTKLDDGFYLSLNNQYISQNKSVISNYQLLDGAPVEYLGEVRAPLFPGIYAAYKKGKIAVSLGINPVGGGGSAIFDTGLPSFEMPISELVPGLAGLAPVGAAAGVDLGVTGYGLNAYLDGSSVFWGFQAGVSYEINDMFSVYLGGRFVYAKNTYTGYLKDITVENEGVMMPATDFINLKAIPTIDGTVANLNGVIGIPDNVAPAILLGYGGLTLDQAVTGGVLTAEQSAGIVAGLGAIGITDVSTITIQQTSDAITGATPTLEGNITALETNKAVLEATAALVADQDADIVQTGTGITPIIGVNISPNDKLNIGLKYEFQTTLELENSVDPGMGFLTGFDETTGDPVYLYTDGETFRNDMPAMFSVGFDYKVTDKFTVASGFHYYFDKNANYGRKLNGIYVENSDVIDRNATEFALGLQYNISEKMLLSIGYLMTQTGVSEAYQTDLSYSNHSNTIGFGGAYSVSPMMDLNLGFGYTMYQEARNIYSVNGLTTIETYDKDNIFIALGLDFKLGGKKSD